MVVHDEKAPPAGRRSPAALLVLLAAMVAVAFLRWRVLDVPLERDEGEYAHTGALLLDGVPPYAEARNMKLPGTYLAYAVLMAVFGETPRGIHLGLLVTNLLTMWFVFRLGRALVDERAGAVAAAVFGALSLSQAVQGIFANAEHFVLLFALPGLACLLRSRAGGGVRWLFPAGLLLGCALVAKQHGAVLALFGGLAAVLGTRPFSARAALSRGAVYALGVLSPYALTCLWLFSAGVFDVFWFWTFDYARTYAGRVPWEHVPGLFRMTAVPLATAGAVSWLLVALGLASLAAYRPARRHAAWLAGFALFSFLAVCPGGYFRAHYFVLLLPAAALLAGSGAAWLVTRIGRDHPRTVDVATAFAAALAFGQVVVHDRAPLLSMTPDEVSRHTYWPNPFAESVAIGAFLRENTEPTDTIAVIGSEPQIYFYADRRPAHPFLYTYALVEDQPYNVKMQEELIRAVEENEPRALVFVQVPTSWLISPGAPQRVFKWMARYTSAYELVQVVDMGPDGGESRRIEGPQIRQLASLPVPGVYVYLRR